MSVATDIKFSLKVTINNQKTKVLFVEADSDFTDVLISFLTLPLGRIVRGLKNHYGNEAPIFGSLTTLYTGLTNLDGVHFWTEGCKDALLNPMSSFRNECLKLKLDIGDTQPVDYFTCYYSNCISKSLRILCTSNYFDSTTCTCGKTMTREFLDRKESQDAADNDGVFTKKKASFIISDDLKILPNTTGFVQTLSNLGITDTDVGEPINVTFGFSEFMDLLKGSLLSRTPVSDIILSEREVDLGTTPKSERGILFHEMEKEATSSNSKKMKLNVMVQKSTNKLLFAQSEEGFIDFLCSLLAIPLGGVECLLGSNTYLKNIDNLYRSLVNINGDKYLVTYGMKNRLMNPNLLHGYISENPILPLSEESCPPLKYVTKRRAVIFSSVNFVKGQGKYIGGPTMYKITDDLTVTQFCMGSILSDLKEMKIPSSDVKELDLEIGLQEGLNILKASLTSTSALTNGLRISPVLMKQPKREQ